MSELIKCLIVDDEPLAIDVIEGYVDQVPQLSLVDTCSDAMSAFQIINEQQIDLIFLDIEMPGINGISFIKSLSNPPAVILTTAFREYAIESYEIEVVDYLLKPISFDRFFKAINKHLKSKTSTTTETPAIPAKAGGSIYVYSNKKNLKVYFDDILYVESIKDYITIHISDAQIISKSTITNYEELLPSSFLRVHRSFIINSAKITAFTHQDIEIGEKEIPIGTSYKRVVLEQLKG
ncbi:MAG: LytTR family DNA-binding domain-containing protein [Cyclobacteriaceae bacterium]